VPATTGPAAPTAPSATRTSAGPSIETETEAPTEPSAATEIEAPAETVKAARAALERLDSYRITSVITENDGSQLTMTLAYVAPDRLRMTALGDGGSTVFDMIAVGQTTYIRGDSGWQTFQGGLEGTGGGALLQLLDLNTLLAQMESGQVTVVGQETLDGVPCTIYEQTQGAVQRRLWVGSDDNLVRKIEGRDESSTFVLTVTDINAPIEIEPPV
jgi:outer membrane lipoprotein-sorting protein